MTIPFPLVQRMIAFCLSTRQMIRSPLGSGKDGDVFNTSHGNAVKFVHDASVYRRERNAYIRLRERKVARVNGFSVPQLISHHDSIQAIEMSIVTPPYVLDFASVRLDEDVVFDSDTAAYRDELIHEYFGEQAGDVFFLLHQLKKLYGVTMLDARPANIAFD